jgi:hypothetical protein
MQEVDKVIVLVGGCISGGNHLQVVLTIIMYLVASSL